MKVVVLYRPDSEHAGLIEDYLHEYYQRYPGRQINLVDVDSLEGADMAQLYGIVRYPAILALAYDGTLQQLWQDEQLPLMDQVDYYLRDQ